jgi:hypothetical protein
MGWRGDGDAAVKPKAPRLNAISNDKHRTGRPQQVREEHASATIQLLALRQLQPMADIGARKKARR